MLTKLRTYDALIQFARYKARRRVVLLGLILLLSSCALSQDSRQTTRLPTDAEVEQYNAQVPPEERIVCREEIAVGTNIPQRKCRFLRDIEETSRFTREQLRNVLH